MRLYIELEPDDDCFSKRGEDWMNFANIMLNHIEKYTVPQYGDKGDDLITGYTAAKCVECVEKYAKRFGSNQREGQELLDMMKIAHYAQCAYDKIQEGNVGNVSQSFTGEADRILDDVELYVANNGGYSRQVKITVELV